MKKILSLDLGITSIGYSILEEVDANSYSLIDYGVSMFDKATDKDGNSKKVIHSSVKSTTNLYNLRKKRKKNLALLFEKFNLGKQEDFLKQEKENIYKNKWELRAKKAYQEKLSIKELFSIFYAIAKHRGYKSLDSDDLLEELCNELNIKNETNKTSKNDEKGKIKQSLKEIEALKESSKKSVASIIYDLEIKKENPIFRNHDNYKYMIRREYINEEIKMLITSQEKFKLFKDDFNATSFIKDLITTIDDQKDSTNDLSLFGSCEYYPKEKVAHQYSLISDIFKMYQSISNINFDKNKTPITKTQIKLIADDFFTKITKGKNIPDIKYEDIRNILKLPSESKIFNKEDSYLSKGKQQANTITKFHFVSNLSKIGGSFIEKAFNQDNKYETLKIIFDALEFEKAPKSIYKKLKDIVDKEDIINLIKNKKGNSLNISAFAMIKFIPFLEQGFNISEIKQKLKLDEKEDYSKFKKGIKYLHINNFEKDNNDLKITNHPVKYAVSATLRLIKHLHSTYEPFDEIRVESTRELSQNDETKKNIKKANDELEKKITDIKENKEYQKIAKTYNKNINKYARKILMYEEQERRDIYTGDGIEFEDIFTDAVDIDHIIPRSLGGLSVKHNLVLVHKDTNADKTNQLPMNYVSNKQEYINRVENLLANHKINWKKKINLLATNLDETFKDVFESKSLRATSYIEALTAQILKRYYPFPNKKKQNDGSSVRHIQGRATSNMRKLLQVKTKIRDTNIHHAIDAILIGFTNASWLKDISDTFRKNVGVIDDEARKKIKKTIPTIELIINDEAIYLEPKELIAKIEDKYNTFGEDSVFYKDIWGKTKTINFWVSKKPMVSKIHKDTIYSKKEGEIYTARESIQSKFIALKITPKMKADEFQNKFNKEFLFKMYLHKTNQNDAIYKAIEEKSLIIKDLLRSFEDYDLKDKTILSEAKKSLDSLIHSDIKDNNQNIIRKVKFYHTNLTGFNIKGGLASKEKTFIGFKASIENSKLLYERIDVSNYKKIKDSNDNSFKVFKNDLVFFINPDNRGGKIVSFLDDGRASFQNSRYPSSIEFQPNSFRSVKKIKGEKPPKSSARQRSINQAIGIIKLNLDILGNIKSYRSIGKCESDLLDFIKKLL